MGKKIEQEEDTPFKSQDVVVYPAHGIGIVTSREVQRIAGIDLKVYIIYFKKDKMTLSIPVDRVKDSGLRAISTKRELHEAVEILSGCAKSKRRTWSRRAQEYENKINSGDIMATAEVIRDLYKSSEDTNRSYSERLVYESALERFASEYCEIESIDMEESLSKISSILELKDSSSFYEMNSETEAA